MSWRCTEKNRADLLSLPGPYCGKLPILVARDEPWKAQLEMLFQAKIWQSTAS